MAHESKKEVGRRREAAAPTPLPKDSAVALHGATKPRSTTAAGSSSRSRPDHTSHIGGDDVKQNQPIADLIPFAAAPTLEVIALLARIAAAVEGASVVPEGLNAEDAGRLCGVSRAKFLEMDGKGQTPRRVELGDGRCPRWLRSELVAWLRRGAPSRALWTQIRQVELRRAG